MNTPASLRRRWPTFVALALGWFATMVSAFAQAAATGSIQGRVYNPTTKEYVRNAEVRLDGTNQSVYTGTDGSFSFENVPAGSASLSVMFAGYDTAKDTFTVTAGQPAIREINLTNAAASAATSKDGGVVKLISRIAG